MSIVRNQIVHPYGENPIFQPYIVDGILNKTNSTDNHTLTQIGLFFAALMCAELKSKIHAMNIDKYTEGIITAGSLKCKVISGRQVRFNNIVQPIRHRFFWVKNNSPLVYLAIRESHKKLGCGLGLQSYIQGVHLIGISAPGLSKVVDTFRKSCSGCTTCKVFFSKKSPFSKKYNSSTQT